MASLVCLVLAGCLLQLVDVQFEVVVALSALSTLPTLGDECLVVARGPVRRRV